MLKRICLIGIVLTLMQGCAYNPIIDTQGRSGTFDKSRAEHITNDKILCKKVANNNTNAYDYVKYGWDKYMEFGTFGLLKAKEFKGTVIQKNCLKQRGHALLF